MPVVATAVAVAGAVTGLVNTISGISDTKKRRMYEQNLASLTLNQQKALAEVVNKQTSEDAKMKILADTLGRLNTARISSITQIEAEKERTKKYLYITFAVGGFLLLGGIIFFSIRNKRK